MWCAIGIHKEAHVLDWRYFTRTIYCRAFSFAGGGLAAAEKLHDALLRAVVKAPITFFDRVPTGCCPRHQSLP